MQHQNVPENFSRDKSSGNIARPVRFGYLAVAVSVRLFFTLVFGLKVVSRNNVPVKGAFILASNHQSMFDPPIVGCSCPREISFAAKKELFEVPILGSIIKYLNSIPVRRTGFDREALVRLSQRLEWGEGIIIFPEGTRYLDGQLHEPKAGIGMLAIQHDVPIVPVYVRGSIRIRRQLWQRGLSVTFGVPFRLADIGLANASGKEGYQEVANAVMKKIANVGGVDYRLDDTKK